MFDMGFAELLVIAVIGLLVIGPKRMPEAIRVLGYWLGKLRRSVHSARQEMEREFGLDEIRRDLHNEALLSQLENERKQIEQSLNSVDSNVNAPAPNNTDSNSKVAGPSKTPMADQAPLSDEEEQEMLKAFDDFEEEFGAEDDTQGQPPAEDEDQKDDDDKIPKPADSVTP
jgi:sec-independent protein translocase protein TatB